MIFAQKNKTQFDSYNREKILRIFSLFDKVLSNVDTDRKRMISINSILKQLFDILGIKYKFVPLLKSKKTLQYYNLWWKCAYELIKNDIIRK